MYKQAKFPVLPELKRIDPEPDPDSQYGYYLLNWSKKERQMYDNWNNNNYHNKPLIFKSTEVFPESHIKYLYDMRFHIADNYLNEIAYQAKCGQEEWSRPFPFNFSHGLDTMVREYCLESAIAHFRTVFFLLSDCLDVQEKSDTSHYLKKFAQVVMSTYFWDGQTGRGLITSDNFSGGYNYFKEEFQNCPNIIKEFIAEIEGISSNSIEFADSES